MSWLYSMEINQVMSREYQHSLIDVDNHLDVWFGGYLVQRAAGLVGEDENQ